MWKDLPVDKREYYKKMILAYAALTKVMAQKEERENLAPIITSKYQEKIFQVAFGAVCEDNGNTSYDASVEYERKYLVGIKTFGYSANDQKVAQFKRQSEGWDNLVSQIVQNANGCRSKDEIDVANADLYKQIAEQVAAYRNMRIESSVENLRGFKTTYDDKDTESVYHVLMPDGVQRKIYVGETIYSKINIDNITILGCTEARSPKNFRFSDGVHEYKYTPADSQLYMNFDNQNIVIEGWDVKFADDPIAIMEYIYSLVYGGTAKAPAGTVDNPDVVIEPLNLPQITESYEWSMLNDDGEVERYSAWNGFYGVGSKLATDAREGKINRFYDKMIESGVSVQNATEIKRMLTYFLMTKSASSNEKKEKEETRKRLMAYAEKLLDPELMKVIKGMVYRPVSELYIPILDAANFHREHPDFFTKGAGRCKPNSNSLLLDKSQRTFTMIFEPSKTEIQAFICQDSGKGIESLDSQAIMGEWLLRKVFQLGEYEPLTAERLDELGITGYRMYRTDQDDAVHFEFVYEEDEE